MLYHVRRLLLSWSLEALLRVVALGRFLPAATVAKKPSVGEPQKPEDLDPTSQGNIDRPYEYYRLLRDQRPVYKPAGQDFYCISRYEDIQAVAKDTETYSSNIVGVLLDKLPGPFRIPQSLPNPGEGSQRNHGVNPVDVLAIQDPPAHKYQKLLTHKIVSADFVRALEPGVQAMAEQLISDALRDGSIDFMQRIAWRLPMIVAMRLVGYPERDYERVKRGCAHAIRLVSGVTTPAEFAWHAAEGTGLYRYCWRQYLKAKHEPRDNITGGLVRAANDPDHPLSDEEAVSIILQLLIAGSDSSASTMGNAVRLLVENPQVEQRLREQPERIPDFIEEVLRLESAFQGHFRVMTRSSEVHGVKLEKGTRVFLLWASGNRDERVWSNPDSIDLERDNLKRHLTFGYGIHACLGRELARMEIRLVLAELLKRTTRIRISGETPHVASLFTRTLVQLPLAVA